jgi:hypothetical protein
MIDDQEPFRLSFMSLKSQNITKSQNIGKQK